MKNYKLIIFLIILSLCSVSVLPSISYASSNEDSRLEVYLKNKGTLSYGRVLSDKGSYERLNSDEYLRMLILKDIDFEVIDTYYTPLSSGVKSEFINDVKYIDDVQYIKTSEVTTKNSVPQKNNKYTTSAAFNDVRVRQIVEERRWVQQGRKEGMLDDLIGTSIIVLVGLKLPVVGAILSFADMYNISPTTIGNVSLSITNIFQETHIWHELYDLVGYVPMVIVETRKTDVEYHHTIYNKNTGRYNSNTEHYYGVMHEYGRNYNKLTQNINEAVGRYNAGLRDPQIYRYYTGTVIDNTNILPGQ